LPRSAGIGCIRNARHIAPKAHTGARSSCDWLAIMISLKDSIAVDSIGPDFPIAGASHRNSMTLSR